MPHLARYSSLVENIRTHLQQEYQRRSAKNPAYSLRAYAQSLGISHATLSPLLAGKRKITPKAAAKLADRLGLSPAARAELSQEPKAVPYHLLQQDVFASFSEWHYDAILELTLLPNFQLTPASVAKALNLSTLKAKLALETLTRLELLQTKAGRYLATHKNSTNILDADFTSLAARKYQTSLLEKSAEAIQEVPKTKRDHTSVTLAIDVAQLPEAKALIKKFRHEMAALLQKASARPNEIYQLQVSFFPLSEIEESK